MQLKILIKINKTIILNFILEKIKNQTSFFLFLFKTKKF